MFHYLLRAKTSIHTTFVRLTTTGLTCCGICAPQPFICITSVTYAWLAKGGIFASAEGSFTKSRIIPLK